MEWIFLLVIIAILFIPPMILGHIIIRAKKKRAGSGYRPRPLRTFLFYLFPWGACFILLISIFSFQHTKQVGSISPQLGGEVQVPAPEPEPAPASEWFSFPKFPWPPPAASAFMTLNLHSDIMLLMDGTDGGYYLEYIRSNYIVGDDSLLMFSRERPMLLHADALLRVALGQAGNYEVSYYSVPDGFALVSRLEQIEEDGSPVESSERWETSARRTDVFSLKGYLKALFIAPPGYYRLIVFVVTPHMFTQSDAAVTKTGAEAWLRQGANILPVELAFQPYTERYRCTALIYEFEKRDTREEAILRRPGRLDVQTHFAKSGIGRNLP